MASNRGVVYMGPRKVEVQSIDYPKLIAPDGRPCNHGVIVKLITTNICGSDQHMYRGRTAAAPGVVLGHENTGEVIEVGPDVEYIKIGDLVSVPFNIACGRCRNCKERNTHICLNTNPAGIGGAYGYVGMGGWKGGQAEYLMVPYADFNLLKFPHKAQALDKIRDLTLLSDILPTGYHGAFTAGVTTGSTVYIAGAGPVGLCCAVSSQLLGAAAVIVGDINPERLKLAKAFGCETIDVSRTEDLSARIESILGTPYVDCAVDCVGFEAHGHGARSKEEDPADLLNSLMAVTRAPGGIGIPGLYLTQVPGAPDKDAQNGILRLHIGLAWVKAQFFYTGQCPVMRYHRLLMEAILHDKIHPAKAVNVTLISLDDAPEGYKEFDQGAAKKFVIDPHGSINR
ncbi:MAG: formaldehyde dehydrogenase, glutathione-independent [Bryobacterales bacterium]|nr:formaldehyde dehydrogenase, glutathione-independent [Bryobacterales bacterium]